MQTGDALGQPPQAHLFQDWVTRNFIGLDATFPIRIVEQHDQLWFVAADVFTHHLAKLGDGEVFKVNRILLGETRGGRPITIVS